MRDSWRMICMKSTQKRQKHGALFVTGCVTSARIMDHIERLGNYSGIAISNNIERSFELYVSVQVISAFRNGIQSCCDTCSSRFYGTKYQRTCSHSCYIKQGNSGGKQKQTKKGPCKKIRSVVHDPQWQWLYLAPSRRIVCD